MNERLFISLQVVIIIKQKVSLSLCYMFSLEGATFAKAYCIIMILLLTLSCERNINPPPLNV